MKLFEGKTPAERNKLIAAIVLGVVAFALLSYLFFGSSSSSKPKNQNANGSANTRTAGSRDTTVRPVANLPSPSQMRDDVGSIAPQTPVTWTRSSYSAPEPGRNIFAFYVPPPKPIAPLPTPKPTPPPPLTLAALSPSSVYARTGDFTIEVSGDKFTPATAIVVDNNPLPTRFINAQQLSATVPSSMISNDGARQVRISSPDGTLYSSNLALMVMLPPVPNYLYIGIIGKQHYNDTAVLKDKGNPKELLNVQRGDVLGGRFRVTSISEREIALTDTTLRIKHTLPFVEEKGTSSPAGTRPGMRNPLGAGDSGIPGIPNLPRYQPGTPDQKQDPDDEGDDEKATKPTRP